MKIEQVIGREIFDSRGNPTIECELVLEGEFHILDSVPAGISTSRFESEEVRDKARFFGMGVHAAIELLENKIAPLLVGKEPDLIGIDLAMLELDGSPTKSILGANTMLSVSMAVCRAQALSTGFELHDFIAYVCDYNTVSIPFPMFNIFQGGVHTHINFPIQELLAIPVGKKTFREALEVAIILTHTIQKLLIKKKKPIIIGGEGGFVVDFSDEREAFDILIEAIESIGESFALAIDVAASHIYNHHTQTYRWFSQELSRDELLTKYEELIDSYPICSIEDGLAESDWDGWKDFMNRLGDRILIVGDDLIATHTELIAEAVTDGIISGSIIKPNQVGTVTETLQAIKFCKENNIQIIASHRSGETNDSFIADLAVGVSASYIKAGGCHGGERFAKYNHLLRIEDSLFLSLMNDDQD